MASNAWRRMVLGALFVVAPALALAQQAPDNGAAVAPMAGAPGSDVAVSAPGGVRTLGELDRIQSELIVAQAKRQLVEAQKALARAQGFEDAAGEGAHLTPVVAGVFGTQDAPYARFLLGAGAEAIGRPGDVLPGEFRVVSVSVEKVVIKDRNGREMIARFSPTPPSMPSTAESAADGEQGAIR